MNSDDLQEQLRLYRETRDWLIFQSLDATIRLLKIPEFMVEERQVVYNELAELNRRLAYDATCIQTLIDKLEGEDKSGQ